MKKLFPYCCIVVAMLSGCSDSQSPPASIPSAEVVQQKLSDRDGDSSREEKELYRFYSAPSEHFQGGGITVGQVRSAMFSIVEKFIGMPLCKIDPGIIDPRVALSLMKSSISTEVLDELPSDWESKLLSLSKDVFPLYAEVPYSESSGVLFFPQNPFLADADKEACQKGDSDLYSRTQELNPRSSCGEKKSITFLLPRIASGGLPDDLAVPCYIENGQKGADGCCSCVPGVAFGKGGCEGVKGTCHTVPKCCNKKGLEFWSEAEFLCSPSGPDRWWFRDPQPIATLSTINRIDNRSDQLDRVQKF